ncbi:MAG: glycosyltransferase family 2 protein [Patescibacteria group bacterium]
MMSLEQLEQERRRLAKELQLLRNRIEELETALEQITTRKIFHFWLKYFKSPAFGRKIKALERGYVDPSSPEGQYRKIFSRHYPSTDTLRNQSQICKNQKNRPKFSLLMPTYNSNQAHLKEAIASVRAQSYDNWELCIADDASTDPEVIKMIKAFAAEDERIKFVLRKQNGHISQATNSALELASGDYIGLVDHDDLLWPNALYECAKAIERYPQAGLIYSDEDKVSSDGKVHFNPFFKPDWSPDYFRSINYITHFTVLARRVINQVGGPNSRYDGAQDWNLFLRATNLLTKESEDKERSIPLSDTIIHIPKILYSWRQSVTSAADATAMTGVKKYVIEAQRRTLVDDLKERGIEGTVEPSPYWTWRVRYQVLGNPLVSIIIPTRSHHELLGRCVDSIIENSTYGNYEIVLVYTKQDMLGKSLTSDYMDSQVAKTATSYNELGANPRIRIFNWKKPFNYSAVNNFAAHEAKGDYYLFLDSNTKVINPDWIESLLEFAQRPDVGVVGAKLLYPDDTIAHAGKILGLRGAAGNGHRLLPADSHGYHHRLSVPQNLSAVSGACAMIPRIVFEEAESFNELYSLVYNDVDLCLRIRDLGKLIVYTPYAQLYHYERKTRDYGDAPEHLTRGRAEKKRFLVKWGDALKRGDPYYNRNLTLLRDDFSFRDDI